MKKRLTAYLFIFLFIFTAFSPSAIEAQDPDPQDQSGLTLTEVYYNTGPGTEFFTIENRGDSNFSGDLFLEVEEGSLTLNNTSLDSGDELTLTRDEQLFEAIWGYEPCMAWSNESSAEIEGSFDLSDDSGKLLLQVDNVILDSFYYGDIDTSRCEIWKGNSTEKLWNGGYAKRREITPDTDEANKEQWEWERRWMVGHSSFEPEFLTYEGYAEVFTAPDNSLDSLIRFLSRTEEQLKISIYQMTSPIITEMIANLSQKGVHVEILAEGVPVGGISEEMHRSLSFIKEKGAEVRTMGKESYSPYNYLHSKYIIRDEEAVLISSENFGDTGFPDDTVGNRGWGLILEDENVTDYFIDVYESDWRFGDGYNLEFTDGYDEFQDQLCSLDDLNANEIKGEFDLRPIISPDTSLSQETLIGMIDSAEKSIYVQQAYIHRWDSRDNPYLTSLKEAASRGVEVKILLDSTWYQMQEYGGENDLIVDELNELSEEKNLTLEARLVSPYKEMTRIHNKGVVVDESQVLVSSINWNANSVLQNREVGVIIEDENIGGYYSEIFIEDWEDDIPPIADAGNDRKTNIGSELVMTAENSWDDQKIERYKWDTTGDGEYDIEGETINLTFEEEGCYEVTLFVEDIGGNVDKDTVEIEVKSSNIRSGEIANWLILTAPMFLILFFILKNKFFNRF